MTKATAVSILDAFKDVTRLDNRTPETSDEEFESAYKKIADYRDGAIYITHYSGMSEWERHQNGDELVQVIEGETTLILLDNGDQVANLLTANCLFVVPQGVWHRFETPTEVKVLTVTPQPTDHSVEFPDMITS